MINDKAKNALNKILQEMILANSASGNKSNDASSPIDYSFSPVVGGNADIRKFTTEAPAAGSIANGLRVILGDSKILVVNGVANLTSAALFNDHSLAEKVISREVLDNFMIVPVNPINIKCSAEREQELTDHLHFQKAQRIFNKLKLGAPTRHKYFQVTVIAATGYNIGNPNEELYKNCNDIEIYSAKTASEAVWKLLNAAFGFPKPISVFAGNGFQLLYNVDLPVTDETNSLFYKVLLGLSQVINGTAVDILHDKETIGAGTAIVVPGTLTSFGPATEERPNRYAKLVFVPAEHPIVTLEQLKDAATLLNPDKRVYPTKSSYAYSESGDLKETLKKGNYVKKGVKDGEIIFANESSTLYIPEKVNI